MTPKWLSTRSKLGLKSVPKQFVSTLMLLLPRSVLRNLCGSRFGTDLELIWGRFGLDFQRILDKCGRIGKIRTRVWTDFRYLCQKTSRYQNCPPSWTSILGSPRRDSRNVNNFPCGINFWGVAAPGLFGSKGK